MYWRVVFLKCYVLNKPVLFCGWSFPEIPSCLVLLFVNVVFWPLRGLCNYRDEGKNLTTPWVFWKQSSRSWGLNIGLFQSGTLATAPSQQQRVYSTPLRAKSLWQQRTTTGDCLQTAHSNFKWGKANHAWYFQHKSACLSGLNKMDKMVM